jgi:hypothetical protein
MILFLTTGCIQAKFQKLAIHDEAVTQGAQSELRCIWQGEFSQEQLPALIPFAIVSALQDGTTRGQVAEHIARKSMETLRPDVIIFYTGQTEYMGSIYSGGLYGGFSLPMYARNIVGVCFRLPRARTGVRLDEKGMVTSLAAHAVDAGLLEGDTLISIGGRSVTPKDFNSPHYFSLLNASEGDEVDVVWIRPGTGRMSGKIRLGPNPPIHNNPGIGLTIEQVRRGSDPTQATTQSE